MNHNGNDYLLITRKNKILEQLISSSYGLYQTTIRPLESHTVMNQKFNDPKVFLLWHERLGHTRLSMMRCIIQNSNRNPLTSKQIVKSHDFSCTTCSQGKLIIIPSFTKIASESPAFLECVQGDICGPIHPPSGPFHYFMVLIDGLMYAFFLPGMLHFPD